MLGTLPAAMLAAKRSAGVAPEVNLRHPLCAGEEAHKRRIHPLKLRAEVIRSLKQGYQWPHKKDSCPPKFKKEKE